MVGKKKGRKPINDCTKKVRVQIMVEGCILDVIGCETKAQMIAYDALKKASETN